MSITAPMRSTLREKSLLDRRTLNRLEAEREDAYVEANARAQLRAMREQAQMLRGMSGGQ